MKYAIIILAITNIITVLFIIFRKNRNKVVIAKQEFLQSQLVNILDTMKQAILLFNNKSKLLFYNKDAAKILNINDSHLKAHATSIFDSKEIRDAIINKTSSTMFDVQEEEKIYLINTYTINEKRRNKDKTSVIVTIKNVTEIRSIEKTKKDFFSHASHELKSPLTAIIGYSELVSLNMIAKEEYPDIFNRIYKQATHMSVLVEEMSTLSRLELAPKDENIESIDLQEILNNVLDSLEPFKKDKNIDIITEAKQVFFKANPLDINKLFKNLIENAIKYSSSDNSVHIDLYQEASKIYFIVKDHGIGISPKHQQRIFERFYRIDKGRLISGTGLGLAIVKHILIKYKGEIKVGSKLNEGTNITVILNNNENN